jgi:hypothetical protein
MLFSNDPPARAGNIMKLYRQVAVWARNNDSEAVRYHLIEDLSARKFSVQSVDFFYPSTPYDTILYLEKNFAILLMIKSREPHWSESIEDAVEAFDTNYAKVDRPLDDCEEEEE